MVPPRHAPSPLITMPKKSNNEKKAAALAAGKAPKKTKQQENAGQGQQPREI